MKKIGTSVPAILTLFIVDCQGLFNSLFACFIFGAILKDVYNIITVLPAEI